MPPGGKGKIEFTEYDVKKYLAKKILFWAEKLNKERVLNVQEFEERNMAPFYLDAYQGTWKALFGKTYEIKT